MSTEAESMPKRSRWFWHKISFSTGSLPDIEFPILPSVVDCNSDVFCGRQKLMLTYVCFFFFFIGKPLKTPNHFQVAHWKILSLCNFISGYFKLHLVMDKFVFLLNFFSWHPVFFSSSILESNENLMSWEVNFKFQPLSLVLIQKFLDEICGLY